jgi:hypothetical protein
VVIDDLDLVSVSSLPDKTNAKPIVDSDAVLSMAVPLQGFQAVSRGTLQVLERSRGVQHPQFPYGGLLNCGRYFFDRLPVKQPFGLFTLEGPDHLLKVSRKR